MPTPTLAQVAARALDATQIVAVTLWGEARAEPIEGIVAVGCVIRSRVTDAQRRWGSTWQDVCLARWQFSCWLPKGGQANYTKVAALVAQLQGDGAPLPDTLRQCWWVARGVMDQLLADNVGGANHYYAPTIPAPSWARGVDPVAQIGGHLFFRL